MSEKDREIMNSQDRNNYLERSKQLCDTLAIKILENAKLLDENRELKELNKGHTDYILACLSGEKIFDDRVAKLQEQLDNEKQAVSQLSQQVDYRVGEVIKLQEEKRIAVDKALSNLDGYMKLQEQNKELKETIENLKYEIKNIGDMYEQ